MQTTTENKFHITAAKINLPTLFTYRFASCPSYSDETAAINLEQRTELMIENIFSVTTYVREDSLSS